LRAEKRSFVQVAAVPFLWSAFTETAAGRAPFYGQFTGAASPQLRMPDLAATPDPLRVSGHHGAHTDYR